MDIPARPFGFAAASAVLVLAGVLAPPQAASADVDDFTFDSLAVDYTLTRAGDGTSRMHVVEEFVAVFPETDQNRGIRRVIPDEYDGQPLRPSFESAVDADGEEWDVVESDGGEDGLVVTARSDDYVHGRQTFVFTYTLENVTRDFPDTGLELYWDVLGFDTRQPVGEMTARIHLDGEVADALGPAACYAGGYGGKARCDDIEVTETAAGATITARQSDLAPRESLTVAMGFAEGTFEPFDSSYLGSPFGWVHLAAGAGMLGAVGWAVWLRRRFLRDESGRPTVIAEAAPPPGVDALQAAVLLKRTSKGIPAEVLEQAVVGSIRITEGEKPRWGSAKLAVELVDASRADENGAILLDGLFPEGEPGDRYEFGGSDTRVSTTAQKILGHASKALQEHGFHRRVPFGLRFPLQFVSFLLVGTMGVVTIVVATRGADLFWPITGLIAGVVAWIVVTGLTSRTPLTAAGAEARDHLAGLRQFIEWAEVDRIRMLQSPEGARRVRIATDDPRAMLELYERLLPYAVVFGQEKQWAGRLAALYAATGAATPVWYGGTGSFDAASFTSGIGSLSTATTASSSSGGSTGGGSAGGGGGGGSVGGV